MISSFLFYKNKFETDGLSGKVADLKHENEVLFTLSADSKDEIDEWAEEVKKAVEPFSSTPEKTGTRCMLKTDFMFVALPIHMGIN